MRVPYTRPEGYPPIIHDRGLRWRPDYGVVYTISRTLEQVSIAFLTLAENPDGEMSAFPVAAFAPLSNDETESTLYNRKMRLHVQRIPHFGPVS